MADEYPYDLGSHARKVVTDSPEAQLWFNRGLVWSYCYNHEEAIKCFLKATEYDPECAMAYWGFAYAKGPNYNKAWIRFDREDLVSSVKLANQALQRASVLAHKDGQLERLLIEALKARFPPDDAIPEINDMGTYDLAYADAMRPVYQAFPDDMDVVAIFVEALICLNPRALWSLETGEPVGLGTVEARRAIEPAFETVAGQKHPALQHLYIHLMEMSPFPELALPAANRLRHVVPDGSHMSHMATHIDAACGHWNRLIESNSIAAVADEKYFSKNKASVMYTIYRAHYVFTEAYGGIMAAQSEVAINAAKRLSKILNPELLSITSPPVADWAESLSGTIAHVLVRFGRWQEILDLELPSDPVLYVSTTAMIRYAKAIALAVLGRIQEAERAQAEFETAREAVPYSRLNSLPSRDQDVLKVASSMLKGELEYRKGNFSLAFEHLREAVRLEDALPYCDPPPWVQPSRHALGALLLEQGHVEEAEKVYMEDLGFSTTLPRRKARLNNTFGLHGLYECFRLLGKNEQARMLKNQRDIAVNSADIPIVASCFCSRKAIDSAVANGNTTSEVNGCCHKK